MISKWYFARALSSILLQTCLEESKQARDITVSNVQFLLPSSSGISMHQHDLPGLWRQI